MAAGRTIAGAVNVLRVTRCVLRVISDDIVKSRKTPFFVIPAKAGIQFFQLVTEFLDSGFHRSDDFLRNHHLWQTT